MRVQDGSGQGGAGQDGVRRRATVLRRMDEEWTALQTEPSAAEACRRWAARAPELAGCSRPVEVLARVAQDPDRVLGVLLSAGADGDRLAARVVLQAMLPKVVRLASVDPAAEVDDYLTAMWCEIAAYPLARRPASVAANLALDTLKAVRRERHPPVDVLTPPALVLVAADRRPAHVVGSQPPSDTPSATTVLERAREHRLLDPATRALLRSVYAEGLPAEAVARRHGLSPGALRTRCSRAVKVLARHAELLGTPA